MKEQTSSKRIVALDVLRGITIAGMILVGNLGDWGAVYAPLMHADWHSLTPTDLVFPFFMFIMGISTYISLRKTNFESSGSTLFKIFKRGLVIFGIGLFLAWVALSFRTFHSLADSDLNFVSKIIASITNFERLRILGVMQRLAITYAATALIGVLVAHKHIPKLIVASLVAYFLLLVFGNGFEKGDTNILAIVDQAVLGLKHMHYDNGLDPEGLLSTIPSIAHVLIGFYFGKILFDYKDNEKRILQFFIYGAILTFAGFLFSYACPINKKIWSPSYVLVTCGMAATFLSLLIWIIDVKGYKRWSVFFESFGSNPLFIYVFASVMSYTLAGLFVGGRSIKSWIVEAISSSSIDPYVSSLVYSLLYVLLCWGVAHLLYKKKIYIKI